MVMNNNGTLECDNEAMDRGFIKDVLCKLVDQAILRDERADADKYEQIRVENQKLRELTKTLRTSIMVREILYKTGIVRSIATGINQNGTYYLPIISKDDDKSLIPEQIHGCDIEIRYIEDD